MTHQSGPSARAGTTGDEHEVDARGSGSRPALTGALVALMAVGSGLSVASNYYVQPLLPELADEFGVTTGAAGLLVTVSQLGYVAGLALVVPLGDRVERRGLVTVITALTALGLLAFAAAPSLAAIYPVVALIGVTSVAAQVFVALAADLARPDQRGRAVGTVMSGLLIGILVARTIAGVVSGVAGWRAVYVLAGGLMLALAVLARRLLPRVEPSVRTPYPALLRSIVVLYREEPVLRRRGLYGALGYASFSALWTSAAFMLDDAYGYSEVTIGLFALLGVAGASAARFAGRLADAGWARVSTLGFFLALAASWAVLVPAERSLALLVVGIVVLDFAVQGAHISNQSEVYRLRPDARSRLTTAYMCVNFTGGVVGSASSAALYGRGGWAAVCAAGGVFSALALVAWATEARWPLTRMRHAPVDGRTDLPSDAAVESPAGTPAGDPVAETPTVARPDAPADAGPSDVG